METQLDRELKKIDRRVMSLSPGRAAAFFASSAERLMPLYESFVSEHGWGDVSTVRRALDLVWQALEHGVTVDWSAQLESMDEQTPHGEEFTSELATFAQHVCGAVDVALLAMDGRLEAGSALDGLETMRVAACLEKTGYLDLGSGPDGERFESELISDWRVQRELRFQQEDLADLEAGGQVDLDVLRGRALVNKWSLEMLLPTASA